MIPIPNAKSLEEGLFAVATRWGVGYAGIVSELTWFLILPSFYAEIQLPAKESTVGDQDPCSTVHAYVCAYLSCYGTWSDTILSSLCPDVVEFLADATSKLQHSLWYSGKLILIYRR